mgnify:FL=1
MTGGHPRRDRSRRASLPWRFPVGRDNGTRSHLHMASARLSYLRYGQFTAARVMRPCLLVVRLTRPRREGGNGPSSRVIHRHVWRAPAIHNRDQSTGSREGRLTHWGHDVVVQSSLPVSHGMPCSRYHRPVVCRVSSQGRWDGTGRPLAVAYGRACPGCRRVLSAGSRLVARAAGSHVGLSSSIRGLRLCTGDGYRRWSSRRPWGHFDSSQRTWPRYLVDVPTCHSHRRCRRSRREGGRYRRRRDRLADATLGRENRATHLHRPNPPDNRAPASAPLGRGHGRVGASRSPSTCQRATLSVWHPAPYARGCARW